MKTVFLIALFNILITGSSLQAQSVFFNRVLPPEGKTFLHITAMVQDKEGYMWFASKKGLYRYDGYTIISYKNNPLNPNSLGSNSLESMCVDSSGIIWIGTFGNGLDRFDPATESFTHFHYEAKNNESLSNDTVPAILSDSKGMIWVGTASGLDRFDDKTGKFIHYRYQANDSNSLSSNQVRTLYEDRRGTLWVGTGSPYLDDGSGSSEGGLNKMEARTGKFIRYMHDPGNPRSLINSKVGAIFEDSKGNFWIGTAGDGLHLMNRATGTFERHRYDPQNPEKLSRPPLNKRFAYDHISFIQEDAAGAIWIGTSDAGINRYDPVTKKSTYYHFENIVNIEGVGNFDDNTSWAAFTSRDGIFWVSTILGNLFRVDPFNRNLPHIAIGRKVNSFYQEPSGALWIAGDDGLLSIDSAGNNKLSPTSIFTSTGPISNHIIDILPDSNDNVWVSAATGLYLLSNKKIVAHYVHDEKNNKSLSDNFITSIYKDHQDTLWLGTPWDVNQMNTNTGEFTHYKIAAHDTNRFSINIISSILEDKQGKLWVGSGAGGGVYQLNKKSATFKGYIAGVDIRCIYEDAGERLWVGADDGLYEYNRSSDVFSRFIDPSSSLGIDEVFSIVEDNEKNLWIGTSGGIIVLNRQRNETTLYGKNYKINGDELTFGSYKAQNGKLYFGTTTGYYVFNPAELTSSSKPPHVVFSGFRIADKLVTPGINSPLAGPLSQLSEIQLPYYENVFSIDFVAIDYTNPQDNRYLFMLENYDKDWHQAGSDRRASYYNVPPGKYIFRVKAANSDGLWAEKTIAIIITPPWWRTWWAYCIYGLLIVVIAYAIHRIQRRRIINQERERAKEKELAQAKQIEKAYNELKTTQAQLIQSEKMASLGELTAGIAHEIQNPLNFVNNFSEVNKELMGEMKDEIDKGNLTR